MQARRRPPHDHRPRPVEAAYSPPPPFFLRFRRKMCLAAQVPQRGANPKQVPTIKRRKSHDVKRVFALFLCRCKKDLRRDHHWPLAFGKRQAPASAQKTKRKACQFGHGVGGFTTNFIHSENQKENQARRPFAGAHGGGSSCMSQSKQAGQTFLQESTAQWAARRGLPPRE